ncbi:MAG TPA: competence/damage-inducible protein A [Terriglobales bacterium]|jgi:nicotinamide-nucleotide amidase|nr:competence/damage-inducible protein A [Terriglobales bacterium]
MIKTAVVLSTGDELTTGKVVDTNSTFIADRLFSVGIKVSAILKVGDDRTKLLWAFRQAYDLGDLVIGTGGLGPTADDLTTELVAEFLGKRLILDDSVLTGLRERFAARGYLWSENNRKQALFPEGATILPNPVGTAPGFYVPIGDGKNLIWLSGVPQEMIAMFDAAVVPWIIARQGSSAKILTGTFKIYGLTESQLDDLVKPLELGTQAKLSFRAHFPDLTLRLTVSDGDTQKNHFLGLCDQIRSILGSHIYAEGDITLEERIGTLLKDRKQTLALAESCTGGLISQRITRVAGSSVYYLGGAVTYSNEAKIHFLGVHSETLESYGAVSRQTALEMSHGIKERTGASIALSVTGIAGPSGGSAEKPVGTVWISIASDEIHQARHYQFHGDRERIILATSQAALHWLRLTLRE